MLDKLQAVANRYEEINSQLYQSEVAAQPELYNALMKEANQLQPIADAYAAYNAQKARLIDAQDLLLESGSDKELRMLAQQEMSEAKDAIAHLTEELKILLLPRDPNDDRNVIVEIRAGAGGEESALFAHSLHRMYTMYAERSRFRHEILNINETELGGCKEVSFLISGDGAYSRLKFESGVHRVQRVPETETGGRIHTSTVTVAVLPEAEDVDIEINPADLQIDTYRSSGAGGQHINKTESAIRITHLPTGTVVECQDERSQFKNKDKAMKVLRSRLLERKQQEQQSAIAADRKSQVGTGDRSERIRTYNFPQGRVTDHRIGVSVFNIDAFVDGDMTPIIEPLMTAQAALDLQNSEQ